MSNRFPRYHSIRFVIIALALACLAGLATSLSHSYRATATSDSSDKAKSSVPPSFVLARDNLRRSMAQGPSCVPAPPDAISWWPGDGNANDVVGGNNGVMAGTAAFAPGMVGPGFSFDGANGTGVQLGNPASLQLQNFTIDAWIQRSRLDIAGNGPQGEGVVVAYGHGGYGFAMTATGELMLTKIDIDGFTSGILSKITDTNFHHVALTKSGNAVVFYIDGVASPPFFYSNTFEFTKNVSIGSRLDVTSPTSTGLNATFAGVIDEVEIFNRALSQTEVQGIFNAGSAGKCKSALPPTQLWNADYTFEYDDARTSGDAVDAGIRTDFHDVWSFSLNTDPNGSLATPTITVTPTGSLVNVSLSPTDSTLTSSVPPYQWIGPTLNPSQFFGTSLRTQNTPNPYALGYSAQRDLLGGRTVAANATNDTRTFTVMLTPMDPSLTEMGTTINFLGFQPQPGPVSVSNVSCTAPVGQVNNHTPPGGQPMFDWQLGGGPNSTPLVTNTAYTLTCNLTLSNASASSALYTPGLTISGTRSTTTNVGSTNSITLNSASLGSDPSDPLGTTTFAATPSGQNASANLHTHFRRTVHFDEVNNIDCPTITLSPGALPNATVGTFYNQLITANGGTGPHTFAVTGGGLPPGMGLSSSGTISGTPGSPGNFNFTISATDANHCTGSQNYNINVQQQSADLSITKTASPSGSVATGSQITYTLNINNAGPSPASNVSVNDPLLPGTVFVSSTTSQGSCAVPSPGNNNPPVNCSLGTISSGGSATITLTVDVTALPGATINNTATVNSSTFDPNQGNNSAHSSNTVAGCDLVVRNTNDSGAHSLRLAIMCANANPGLDTITFNIPGGGVHTIQPLTGLPAVTDPVLIDGYTQPGVQIDGIIAGPNAGLSLFPGASGSTIRGLVISRFSRNGIAISGASGVRVEGNVIGSDAAGVTVSAGPSGSISDIHIVGNASITGGAGSNGVDVNAGIGCFPQPCTPPFLALSISNIEVTNNVAIKGGDTGVRISANNQNGPASISGVSVNGNSLITGGPGGFRHGGVDIGASGTNAPASIRDVTVNGNGPISTSGLGTGVSVNSPSNTNIFVDGNTSIAGNLSGVGINGPPFTPVSSTNISVSNNQSINGGTGNSGLGVGIGSNTASVTHTTIKVNHNGPIYGGFRGVGIGTTTNTGPNITVNHNDIEVMNNGSIKADFSNSVGILVGACAPLGCNASNSNIKINGNSSAAGIASGIRVGGCNGDGCSSTTNNITINSNSSVRGDGSGSNGIQVGGCAATGCTSSNSNITISGNGSSGNVQAGSVGIQLSSAGTATTFSDVSVTGNTVVMPGGPADDNNGSRGINLYAISLAGHSNMISGNDVSGATRKGIFLVSPNGSTTVSSNHVHNNPGIGIGSHSFTGLVGTGSTISSNLVHDNGTAGVSVEPGTDGSGNVTATNSGNKIISNTIYNNGFGGVGVIAGTFGNTISQNSIYSNGASNPLPLPATGIDLSANNINPDGVTPNDPCDPDTGGNNLQNFPVLTSVSSSGGTTTIQGTLNSTPNTTFTLELFANAVADPSGFGEGQTFIGSTTVTTDGNCNASFTFTGSVPSGQQFITATATDPGGNTSEFSHSLQLTSTAVQSTPNPSVFGQSVTFTATVTSDSNPVTQGSVTFKEGATLLSGPTAVDANGQASFSTTNLNAGSHTITAEYSGTANFSAGSGQVTQSVNKADTTTSLTSIPNPSTYAQPVTFTATVTAVAPGGGTPTGSVTFYDGTTLLGTATLNSSGQATFTTSSLFIGVQSITATYNGDANYNSSTSSPLIQTVVPPPSTEDVKVTGGGSIPLTTGGGGSFGLVGKVSSADVPSGNVEYQDHDTGMNVHATTITAVVVNGTHAQVFGKATINGSGSFDFVVDVDDIAEPGINVDTFRIQLSNGYTAGPSKLSGGNIQVHK